MKLTRILSNLQVLKTLVQHDIMLHNSHLLRRCIDTIIWASCVTIVAQYLLPLFGMSHSFGIFLVISNSVLWGLFEINSQLAEFLSEIEGGNIISYFLTLPLPASLVFVKYALGYAYRSWISSFLVLTSLFFIQDFGQLHLTPWSIFSFLFMHFLANLFFGFFCLFTVSLSPDVTYTTTIRSRVIFPLWHLGCANFTWLMLYQVSPFFAYLNLLNPMTYLLEGIRASILPQFISLSYGTCVAATIGFIILFGYLGIIRLKKRLDCL
jgi:ABC-type polysaccharide/polyol phosphate export permease